MSNNYCCDGFEMLVSNMGQAGLSVVLKKGEELTYFCLQSRACAAADIDTIRATICPDSGKVRVVEQMGLQYCPSCGFDLKEWIVNHSGLVEELACQSRELIME